MSSHSDRVLGNVATLASATMLSRVLGFVRDLVIAYALGAGPAADAFFVAFRLPNLMRRLFGEGSLTLAFVPVFAQLKNQHGLDTAAAMARAAMAWMLVLLGSLCVLAVIFAEPLTLLIAPGFSRDAALLGKTVTLVRICFPYALFICAVALCMGILNALDHFLAPALAPCFLNLILIGFGLAAWALDGPTEYFLAWGVLVAGLVQWLVQQPALRRVGFSWRGAWSFSDQGVKQLARLMPPAVFGAAVYQVNVLLVTMLASFLPQGSVSYLYYADRLVQFPLGIFGVAIGVAALPSLANLAAAGREHDYAQVLRDALGLTLFISVPAAAGLVALSEPIVATLFSRGAFDALAAVSTARALEGFCLGLPAFALARPLVSGFYARQDTRTPLRAAALSVAANLLLALALMPAFGHVGLALSASLSSWINVLLLYAALRRSGRAGNALQGFLAASLRIAVLSALCGALAWAVWRLAPGSWRKASLALIPLWIGLYFYAAKLLALREAELLIQGLRTRLNRVRHRKVLPKSSA